MTRQPFDPDAWLGPAADEATDDQKAAIAKAAEAINARWPDEDDADLREQALNAAAQVILEDDTLETHAGAWVRARRREQEAHAAVTGAIIATAHAGASELSISQRTGITRPTVRKALGKR